MSVVREGNNALRCETTGQGGHEAGQSRTLQWTSGAGQAQIETEKQEWRCETQGLDELSRHDSRIMKNKHICKRVATCYNKMRDKIFAKWAGSRRKQPPRASSITWPRRVKIGRVWANSVTKPAVSPLCHLLTFLSILKSKRTESVKFLQIERATLQHNSTQWSLTPIPSSLSCLLVSFILLILTFYS